MKSLPHSLLRRPRLLIAIAVGLTVLLTVAAVLPATSSWTGRALAGWSGGVWTYLALLGWHLLRAPAERVKAFAAQEDPGATTVVALLSVAAVASLVAIVLELATFKSVPMQDRALHLALTVATLAGSWLLVGVEFMLHYAYLFYRAPADKRPLKFPDGETNPDYWDFLYFSFTIAAAAQTSDVSVMSRQMRKAVLAQTILSFIFNAAIVGLSINVAAGLVAGN